MPTPPQQVTTSSAPQTKVFRSSLSRPTAAPGSLGPSLRRTDLRGSHSGHIAGAIPPPRTRVVAGRRVFARPCTLAPAESDHSCRQLRSLIVGRSDGVDLT